MSKNSDVKILIVGAGIGGLSLAIALRRQGHETVVLEQAPQLEARGAGITLFPNAMSGLESLGVASDVRSAGAACLDSAILKSDGRRLANIPATVIDGTVAVHRAGLQTALLTAAVDLGAEVQVGRKVISIEQDDRTVTVHVENGSELQGQLLVGADGVWSVTRGSVAPGAPIYGGYTVWRGISPVPIAEGCMTESWGVGERFGLVDIGQGTYWFATANAPEGDTDPPNDHKAQLVKRFARWHPNIPEVLEATPDEAILRNDVYYLPPLPRWSHGRVVMLGDAAHATTPGIGQGAGQAIEDAVLLADLIGTSNRLEDPEHLRDVLARYENARRPRAELTLRLSLRADRAAQLQNPMAVRARNLAVAATPSRLHAAEMHRLVHPDHPRLGGRQRRTASSTAAVVASMRAAMPDRPSSPAGDTEAARRLAQALDVPRRARQAPIMRPYVEGRTRFFDSAVAESISQAGQVVIIGAGYDDRGMRFRAPGVQFIEVDHPATQHRKRDHLDQLGIDTSDIRFVAVDLAVDPIDGALRDVVNPDAAVTFLCEAIMPYLTCDRVQSLLTGLGALCPTHGVLYLEPALLPTNLVGRAIFPVVKLLTRVYGEPIHTVLSEPDMNRLLAETGWTEQSRTTGRDLQMSGPSSSSIYLRLLRIPNQ